MSGLVARVDSSSVGSMRAVFASRLFRRQSADSLLSAAAEAYWTPRSTLGPLSEKVESEIVTYVEEQDQWDLPGKTASANAGLPLFEMPILISISGTVERLYQPFPSHAFPWWGASPSPSIFGRRLDWPFGGVYRQEYPHLLLCHVCLAEVAVSTSTPQSVLLEELYQIEDSEAVAGFLAQNAFLYDLLVEAHGKIVEFFGEDADMHLEVSDDPDSGGDRQLYAVIVTSLAAMDAISIQERFDDAWWLDNLMRARGKFNIIVEYV
jgi:hypothetical protein